jgi:hypothetical protein
MYCPNCRHDNAATTRFCTSCGAVLVESTPDGRRRRVLRPWGLRRSAPLTESPAMPDIVAAVRQDARRPLSRRLDLQFAAGTAVVALAGTFLYPYARDLDRPAVEATPSEPVVVTTTATHAARESVVASPLVEPVAPPRPVAQPVASKVTPPRDPPAPSPRAVEPASATLPHDAAIAELPPIAPPVVAAVPATPRDRWQPLKDALATCASQSNVFERAICEQGARLEHCGDYWGAAPLCPAARNDSGQ